MYMYRSEKYFTVHVQAVKMIFAQIRFRFTCPDNFEFFFNLP